MLKLAVIIGKAAVFVCALWALTLLSLLFHELGHALAYTLATGDRNWHIEVGQGKKILDTKVLTVRMLVLDGYFLPDENRAGSVKQRVITLIGGPAASLLTVTGLLFLRSGGTALSREISASGLAGAVFWTALLINSFILFWSVIPGYGFFRNMEDVGSDVMQIIDTIKRPRE